MTKAYFAAPLRLDVSAAGRPFAATAPRTHPADYLFRAIAVRIKAEANGNEKPYLDYLKDAYGECDKTRTVAARLLQIKSASIPADTTTSGWADALVQTVIGDFTRSVLPNSIYGQMAARGDSFMIDRNGAVQLPARNTSATVAGSFIAQGAPIPVRQGQFLPILMTLKKLGVITTATREIMQHSTPSIEGIIKTAMTEDTTVAIDSILVDAGAATAIRPAGLKNGVTKVTASGTATIVGLIADLKGLATGLIGGVRGNLRSPVFIMNPLDALAASFLPAAASGDFPFADQISRGTLMGIPLIQSTNCPVDTMFLLDAADFITVADDAPEFDLIDQTVLHMEDSVPLGLATGGSTPTFASPERSLWQTDSIAIRMIWSLNWSFRRTGTVQWTDGMAWNP